MCVWGGAIGVSEWMLLNGLFEFGGLTARMRIGPIGERGMEKRKGKKLEKETIITLVFRAYIPCIRSEDGACEAEKNEKNQEKKQIRKRRATGKGGLKLDHEIGENRKRCMYQCWSESGLVSPAVSPSPRGQSPSPSPSPSGQSPSPSGVSPSPLDQSPSPSPLE